MCGIEYAMRRAFEKRRDRNYDTTYWAIDIHDTIVPSTYTYPNTYNVTAYDHMLECLQLLSGMPDHKIILWSCTAKERSTELIDLLKTHDINIDFYNENPECESTDICDFNSKFYTDLIIEDKAGWNPYKDWSLLYVHLLLIKESGTEEIIHTLKNNEMEK